MILNTDICPLHMGIFLGLPFALRSHDKFKVYHWSSPPPPIVSLWQVFNSWIVHAWSLKNKEVFESGVMDCPCMEPEKQGGVPEWTCGLSPCEALKTRRCSGLIGFHGIGATSRNENISLHLYQNKWQNLRTPPLPSYTATPTLLEGDPYLHKWHNGAL